MTLEEKLAQLGRVKKSVPLSAMTTYKIGGEADYVLFPKDTLALMEAVRIASRERIPCKLIGKGSDLLCADEPYHGMVIRLDHTFTDCYFDGEDLIAEAGCSIIRLAYESARRGLSGLEFATGIPGTLGGTVFMNAGAYRSSMADVLTEVCVLRDGDPAWIQAKDCAFGYRSSLFQSHPDWVVLAARMRLEKRDPRRIEQLISERRERRMASQPLEYPSCGSVFRNPEGEYAWKYIDRLGYRGKKVGGAQVSEKHSNFIINTGGAKASDVDALIRMINEDMNQKFGFRLKTEVERFNWPAGRI